MRKSIQKMAIILCMAVILNSGFNPFVTDNVVRAEDTREDEVQSY